MLLTYRLVHLIETHSDALSAGLLEKVEKAKGLAAYQNLSSGELQARVGEIYSHLGQWLLDQRGAPVEKRYSGIGTLRAGQGVPLSQLLAVIVLTKENLWEFVTKQSSPDSAVEVFAKQELLELLDGFFDRAMHSAAVGYEWALDRNSRGVVYQSQMARS
jgi:hypothetical protein